MASGEDRMEKIIVMLRRDPDDSFLKHALALEYVKAGQDDMARTLFETILKNDPDFLGSYYQLGKLLERNGDLNAASELYGDGMKTAARAGDRRTFNELQAAQENLAF
ncbi:MAG TPA: tetratricopeptide repeat protein [Puia sp.]|nr:tetratricopeptide repeat protein [Puia sp.]